MKRILLSILVVCHISSAIDLPNGVSENQYCEGCIATVKELLKKLTRKTDSKDLLVMDSMEKVCRTQNFVAYEYSPPKTVKACQLLLERHDEAIESFLIKDGKDAEQKICYDISNACTEVDRNVKPTDHGDIDLAGDGKGQTFSKVVDIDPDTGKVKVDKTNKGTETKQQRNAGKTLSKKDKKKKTDKKSKSKSKKKEEEPAVKKHGGVDYLNVDINDPNSIKNVLNQINQIKKDHEKKFNEQAQKDEL